MVIDKNLLEKKLETLKEYLAQIEAMDLQENSLVENLDIQQLLSFRLQQAIEASIDIATYLIAGLSLERQETAKTAFAVLGKEKIIASDLAEKMGLAGGLRNLIVHSYGEIDFRKLFYDYEEDLNDLREFARQVNDFLEKAKTQ